MTAAYLMMMANSIVIGKGSALVLGFNIFVFAYLVYLNLRSTFVMKFFFIYLYLIFILTLIITTSSDLFSSFRLFAKYGMGVLAFPAGFYLFKKVKDFKVIGNLSIIFMVLFILNLILSNVYHLGGSRYGEESLESGNLFDDALYCNVCIAVMMPFFFFVKKKQPFWVTALLMASIVFSCILMKRTVIACFVFVFMLYYFLKYYFINKYGRIESNVESVPWMQKAVIFFIIVSVAFTFWGEFEQIFMARENTFGRSLDQETRTQELIAIYEDIVSEDQPLKKFLLGQETFNTVGTYAHGKFGGRMIHENLGVMLNGTGVIGLLFYIILDIYWLIVLVTNVSKERIKRSMTDRLLIYAYIAMWMVYNIAGLSGCMRAPTYLTFSFALMGGIYRYFYSTQDLSDENISKY